MSKSFHSALREALDDTHQNEGRLSAKEHYTLKRAMRDANMKGRQFQSADELAAYVVNGMRFQ